MEYTYTETVLEVKEGMKLYITTDGFLDQNGGDKGFPFGKKRFRKIIQAHHDKPMKEQKEIFLKTMKEYEEIMKENHDRNDDMTVIGFEIKERSNYIEEEVEEIFAYEGVITQNVIATSMDNIEAKIDNMSLVGTLSTITIEMCQNIMNYSKSEKEGCREIVPQGHIEILYIHKEDDKKYEVISRNIISKDDKEKIEPKLKEIQSLDKAGIKKRYRELRRSGENTHEKGGGIGLYEIAKISTEIIYNFEKINDDKYYFTLKSIVIPKKRKRDSE
jgi:hypothetical protein